MNAGERAHEHYDHLLDRALDGDLETAELNEFEEHRKICLECADRYAIIRATQRAWKGDPADELPDEIRDAVGDRVRAEIAVTAGKPAESSRRTSLSRLAFVTIPLAAAAAIAVALLLPDETPTPQPTIISTAPQTVAAIPRAEEASDKEPAPGSVGIPVRVDGRATLLRGADKTVPITKDTRLKSEDIITLDTGARLEVDVAAGTRFILDESSVLVFRADGSSTNLELKRGVITARVEKLEADEEFIVTTPAGRVEVRGTVFQVEVRPTAEAAVRVAEGKVLVRDSADERNVVAVEQGQSLALDWNDPTVRPIENGKQQEILSLFDMRLPAAEADSAPPHKIAPKPARFEQLFEEALRLRKQRRFDEALDIYQKIARGARTKQIRAEAWFTTGQLRYLSGDFAGARRTLSAHRKLFNGTPYEEMAEFYLREARAKLENIQP